MCVAEWWAASLFFVRVLDGDFFCFFFKIAVGRVFHTFWYSDLEGGPPYFDGAVKVVNS